MTPKNLTLTAALLAAAPLLGISTVEAHEGATPHKSDHGNPYMMEQPAVKPGIEVLLAEGSEHLDLMRGKRIGLITNPSGVDSKLVSTIDLLHEHPEVKLQAIFGPEHGARGEAYAGDHVETYTDEATGIPVYSLYGATRRPKEEWLANLDVLVYDIQDVGSSSYTYIYTMAYGMEAAAKRGIPFVVLDRPNPCGADYTDGPVLDTMAGSSFVGLYDIAYMYGMTPGEAAKMFNEVFNKEKCELHVVPMEGYERWMRQWDTGLPFVPTSTHIPYAMSSIYYSLTGIIGEIRDGASIGVGYTLPFETIAAPWIDRDELTEALRERPLDGIVVRPITYKPRYASYKDELIQGVHLVISNPYKVRPVTAQVHIMDVLQKLYPEQGLFSDEKAGASLFDKVVTGSGLRKAILEGKSAEEILSSWEARRAEFEKLRASYLIYK